MFMAWQRSVFLLQHGQLKRWVTPVLCRTSTNHLFVGTKKMLLT